MKSAILIMAMSDAEFDRRPWLSMGKSDRRRYLERSLQALMALHASKDLPENMSLKEIAANALVDEILSEELLGKEA